MERIIKELEQALDGQSFWSMTTHDSYLTWMRERLNTYQSYMNQEGDRTNRFPVTLAKNLLALLREQEQVSLAHDMQVTINRYSEH